jgi:hypothetical protein
MNGYRSHLLCRPVVRTDANEKQSRWQVAEVIFSRPLKKIYAIFTGANPAAFRLPQTINVKAI